jgi:hypothetical protein
MNCPPHDLETVSAKPGDLFSGTKERCRICGLFASEIGMGMDRQYTLIEMDADPQSTKNRHEFTGTLDECFAEARRLGYQRPRRYTRMSRIADAKTEIRALIMDATQETPPAAPPKKPATLHALNIIPFPARRRISTAQVVVPDDYRPATAHAAHQ